MGAKSKLLNNIQSNTTTAAEAQGEKIDSKPVEAALVESVPVVAKEVTEDNAVMAVDEDIAAMDNDTKERNTVTEAEKAPVSNEDSIAEKREEKLIALPAVAEEANARNAAIEDVKAADMDKESDVITEIVANIAAVREKRAAIRSGGQEGRRSI